MKTIFATFLSILLFFSCSKTPRKIETRKYKILKVESSYIYGGLTNEKEYILHTEKYKIFSRKKRNVGDTISINIVHR